MSARADGFILKGWHVLAAILGFFATVIAVNAAFITLAIGSFPGEDVRRSYLQGLHYNDTLAERQAQQSLGWRAGAALRGGAEGAELVVIMRARDGAPLDGLELDGELERRTSAEFDRALAFTARGDGAYVAPLGDLPAGHWRLRARAAGAGADALDFESDLSWPPR
jgi:nitrogen fixation protein FixH